ncbi:MAG: response regulator [Candidatus Falkowbacteria bacterium]
MRPEECRVLIIKGSEEIRTYTKEILEMINFKERNIFTSNNTDKALELLKTGSINLVLSESESGIKLLSGLKETDLRAGITFIFYTGGGEAYARGISEKYGADGFIALPTTLKKFSYNMMRILKKM